MECEMCGKKVGTRRHLVEGNVMNLGACCSRYGTPLDKPATGGGAAQVHQGLERRATRMASKDVFQEEQLDLAEDFGRRIQQGRTKKGISKEDLGGKVHARVPELNKFEAGQLRPTLQQARALERELGITLLEKAKPDAPAPARAGGASGSLTIGDLIKDARKKK